MTRTTKAILAMITIAAVSALGLAIMVLNRGFSAKAEPLPIEAFVARHVRRLAIPTHAGSAANPVPATSDMVAGGMRHFADHCAVCHANDGSGDTAFGRNLYPRPSDLRLPPTQSLPDGELFYVIENGIRFTGMPAFGTGTEEGARDTWMLVRFVRHLPKLTPEELAEMRTLNPKSPEEFRQEEEIRRFLEGGEPRSPLPDHVHK